MAKQGGMGDRYFVGGYDLSGDVNALDRIASPIAVWDLTDITQSAHERVQLKRDGFLDWTTYFNKATARAHARLKLLPTTDTISSYFRGTALGGPCVSINALQVGYDWNRDNAGGLLGKVNNVANGYGLEWGASGTAGIRTDTAATNGSSVDLTAAFGTPSFGAQFYLHVFAFTGTSVTVKIQSSSDNAVGDPFADVTGAAFTAATGITSQRIATSSTLAIERYLRVVTTGTFSNAQFAVTMHPNAQAVVF